MQPTRAGVFLKAYLRLGTEDCADSGLAKNILLTNQISAGLALGCLAYGLIRWIALSEGFRWEGLAFAAAYASLPWVNGLGWNRASRLLLIVLANLSIALAALSIGSGAGIHLFYLPLAWISLMLFAWEEKVSIAFGMLLSSSLLLVIECLAPIEGWERHHVAAPNPAWRLLALLSVLACQILVVLFFLIVNRRTESRLIRAGAAATAADKSKSRFLANMSHEIRTPLNGILGMSTLLMKTGLRMDQEDLIQIIQSTGQELMEIAGEILDLSRIEAGKMDIERSTFEIRPLLEAVSRTARTEARQKSLQLETHVDERVPSFLDGDASRIRQVLNQLLGNAVKFTQRGTVTLKVRYLDVSPPFESRPPGQDSDELAAIIPNREPGVGPEYLVEFQVSDTGPGIQSPDQERIFMPPGKGLAGGKGLEDLPSGLIHLASEAGRGQGSGLGLYITRHIVEMMGGRMSIRSGPTGSNVFVSIPLKAAALPTTVTPAGRSSDSEAQAARALNILIVEDHPLNQKVLAGFLAQYSFRIHPVYSGREALSSLGNTPFHLVFMDCHMPGMDGYECTRKIRASGMQQPIIIGVTADAMSGTRERCLQAGMDDVVTKPILSWDLDRVLAKWTASKGPDWVRPDRVRLDRVGTPGHVSAGSGPAGPDRDSEWVDIRHLREMDEWIRTYDPDFWNRAIQQFEESLERLAASIRREGDSGQYREAQEATHALKGLCFMLGLKRMGDVCKNLEAIFTQAGAPRWQAELDALQGMANPSLSELRSRVGGD